MDQGRPQPLAGVIMPFPPLLLLGGLFGLVAIVGEDSSSSNAASSSTPTSSAGIDTTPQGHPLVDSSTEIAMSCDDAIAALPWDLRAGAASAVATGTDRAVLEQLAKDFRAQAPAQASEQASAAWEIVAHCLEVRAGELPSSTSAPSSPISSETLKASVMEALAANINASMGAQRFRVAAPVHT